MNDEKIWLETEDGQKLFIIKSEKIDMQEELNKTIETLHQELQRKDNIINELKEWLNEPHITYNLDASEFGIEKIECVSVKDTLNKINELERKGKL